MMRSPLILSPDRVRPHRGGFTLVEVMMASAVGAIVLAAVASIIVMSLRITYKNQQIDASATNTRLVQEHINGEMSIAISQTSPVSIRPLYSLPSSTTPARFSRVAYRVQVGSFATVQSDTVNTASSITVVCPTDIIPKENDYLLMDTPNLGAGIRITAVSPENSSGPVTLTLETTILAGTVGTTAADFTNPAANSLVRIHRQRAYETVAPATSSSPVTELHWYETWYEPTAADTPYVVLSRNVDATSRYLFAQVPEEPDPSDTSAIARLEPAVSWQFSYVSQNNGVVLPGTVATYYQTNYAEGLIMPKSGNPLNTSSILGGGSTTTSTTSTTTSSTTSSTTTSTTTSSFTTTSTTTSSTTSSFTTTSSTTSSFTTTSTTTSTSTSSTTSSSTTSVSTSSTTTSSTTSVSTSSTTTSFTTTSTTTSVSTSSTTTSSTTSVSTSSTTTSFTTTSTTTSVSTSSTSTSSTTSTSTSSTTSVSTSSTTTSASTSSTTTSSTTSATTTSTTTSLSTSSTTTSSTTTSTTTTSIAFDG